MRLRILAVDDDPISLEMFQSAVKLLGYDVVTFSDSREAALRVTTEKFDMVATDIFMPHIDGFELAERVRRSRSNHAVPILMFTSSEEIETMRKGYAAGVTFFITKPLSAVKLRGLFGAARGLMVKERRRYARLPLRSEVRCQLGAKRFTVHSLNVAQGGMLLESCGGLSEGEIVEVQFALPGTGELLVLMGRVVRKEQSGIAALQFISGEASGQAALQRYIQGMVPL